MWNTIVEIEKLVEHYPCRSADVLIVVHSIGFIILSCETQSIEIQKLVEYYPCRSVDVLIGFIISYHVKHNRRDWKACWNYYSQLTNDVLIGFIISNHVQHNRRDWKACWTLPCGSAYVLIGFIISYHVETQS